MKGIKGIPHFVGHRRIYLRYKSFLNEYWIKEHLLWYVNHINDCVFLEKSLYFFSFNHYELVWFGGLIQYIWVTQFEFEDFVFKPLVVAHKEIFETENISILWVIIGWWCNIIQRTLILRLD